VPPLHSNVVGQLVQWAGPPADDVLTEMEERAEREGFPTVGPEAGRTLALCAGLVEARTVLELGSGFGYSAYWIARSLPEDGTVTLTDRDAALLDDARSYFERGGLGDRAVFEHGDALEVAAEFDGPVDLVLLDHDTPNYVRGFETVRDLVPPGGAVVADNVLASEDVLTPEGLLATLRGEPAPNDRTRAVATFLEHVRDDPDFETTLLPVDEGLAVSRRVE
jgi:predicted O-methyltransferase YrrM